MFKKLLFAAALMAFCLTAYSQGITVWEENFDNASDLTSIGWSQESNATDGGWKLGTPTALSSQSFNIGARTGKIVATNDDGCNCNKANELLKTPSVDLTAQAGGQLFMLFDLYYYDNAYQGKQETFSLLVSTDGGTNWTNLKSFDGSGSWQNSTSVNISAYAGMADVRFAFRYDDAGGWLWGAALDNIRIAIPDDIIRARLSTTTLGKNIEPMPRVVTGYTSLLVGDKVTIRGTVANDGFPVLTSYDVTITRGLETFSDSYAGLNIDLGKTHTFTYEIPVLAGANDFDVVISNVNGVGDNDPADNSGSGSINGVEAQPGRKVVVEEGTGPWCGWCPRGAVMMDYLESRYPDNLVTIAVHNGSTNPMKVVAYDSGLGLSAFPGGKVDRGTATDPLNFERQAIPKMTESPKVLITQDVTWDPNTRLVEVTSWLNFQEDLNGLYRIAVAFTEDNVTGTGSQYAQVNYYAGGGQGPMGGYETLPTPVPATQMVYNHVAREIVGGFKGAAGSVPLSNPAGTVMAYKSTYTVPASYNIDNMHAITLLVAQTSGQIVNAESTAIPFTSTAAPTLENTPVSVAISPNPVQDEATLTVTVEETSDVQIRIVDAFGRVVAERIYADISGKQYLPFRAGNLANGMYTLVATAKGQVVSKQFVIAR